MARKLFQLLRLLLTTQSATPASPMQSQAAGLARSQLVATPLIWQPSLTAPLHATMFQVTLTPSLPQTASAL